MAKGRVNDMPIHPFGTGKKPKRRKAKKAKRSPRKK